MGTVYRKTFTKPLPPGAELFTRKGQQLARWKIYQGQNPHGAGNGAGYGRVCWPDPPCD
jgi:hypothetical protein